MTHYALSKKRDFSIQKQVLQTYQLILHRAIHQLCVTSKTLY